MKNQTFDRLTAARHYGHEDMKLLDKHIDYENTRAPAYRAIVQQSGELLYFPNLTLAREHVRDNVLSASARKKFAKTQLGYVSDVVAVEGWKKTSKPKAPKPAVEKQLKPNNKDCIIISMTVNDKRVKIECPSTKHAVELLKKL